ncbi:type II secretion system F family protein [Gammaproteobacteria bacterium]|nr:type II secretion system F family protein [Gammaproteobacteria bacterium]MDA7845111.1 type II secretion system F family protein [Gammaproteobacteria bacterium]MDA9102731.1 type II secretion system F family protein [Gammaproteobacteria bacterium]
MPAYSYTALDISGIKKKGVLSAQSERDARKLIKELNLTPMTVQEAKGNLSNLSKVKNKDIVIMTRQLATLLEANTSIMEALKITADQSSNKNLVHILYNLREDIIQGKRLGLSMQKYPGVFSDTYTSLVSAGDSSGNLDTIFDKLADYLEESASIKQQVLSALTYPIILIGFSVIVIICLLAFVLPQVIGQFIKAGAELPFLTKALLALSNNIVLITIILIIIFFGFSYLYKQYIKDPQKHIYAHKKLIALPLVGNFILTSEIERFSSTMALLLESGTNLDVALEESSKIFSNKYLSQLILNAKSDVMEGKDFVYTLKQTNIFPDIFIQLISSGYKSGNLIKMFQKVSHFLKNEIESKRAIFLSLLEPLVIIFMGGFIMLIVLAILVPIMQMNTLSLG